ncbi:MAG TPA: hypothetical protein VF618_09415 [Thermoanaerobaculia bacterium]
MKSGWQVHRGKRFLYCDFSNFGRDVAGLKAEVEAADAEIVKQPKDTVLALADLRGTVTSSEVVDLFKHSAVRTKGYVKKQAVVGISGIQKVLAQAVAWFSRQALVLFDNADDAKDWLADAKQGGQVIAVD